jgi:hypothetical protein
MGGKTYFDSKFQYMVSWLCFCGPLVRLKCLVEKYSGGKLLTLLQTGSRETGRSWGQDISFCGMLVVTHPTRPHLSIMSLPKSYHLATNLPTHEPSGVISHSSHNNLVDHRLTL